MIESVVMRRSIVVQVVVRIEVVNVSRHDLVTRHIAVPVLVTQVVQVDAMSDGVNDAVDEKQNADELVKGDEVVEWQQTTAQIRVADPGEHATKHEKYGEAAVKAD